MLALKVYLLWCILWMIYSVKMQLLLYYDEDSHRRNWHLAACIVLNFLFCPIAMIIAIIRIGDDEI